MMPRLGDWKIQSVPKTEVSGAEGTCHLLSAISSLSASALTTAKPSVASFRQLPPVLSRCILAPPPTSACPLGLLTPGFPWPAVYCMPEGTTGHSGVVQEN